MPLADSIDHPCHRIDFMHQNHLVVDGVHVDFLTVFCQNRRPSQPQKRSLTKSISGLNPRLIEMLITSSPNHATVPGLSQFHKITMISNIESEKREYTQIPETQKEMM
jgi:hypothetical protein